LNDYSNEYSGIIKENIIKSFKINGISNKLDGSEDFMFVGYEIINNLNKNLNLKKVMIQVMIIIAIKKKLLLIY